MRKCYKWLVPAFLFVSLACAVFGLVTNAKYVHEKQGATVTLTINYKQNYLAPKNSLPDFSATKLVFTTLDRLSTYNIAYDELTNQADAGYDDVTATTTNAIRYGYDATEQTGYFISMTNRPIVPYSCVNLFYNNAKLNTIDFGGTVTVGTDEEGNEIKVPLFDTSTVEDMGGMFSSCTSLTSLDLSNFDTSNVKNMSTMFSSCTSLASLNVSNFDTSNVTNMTGMFRECSFTSLDVSRWVTSKVTNMSYMFYDCSNLGSLDLSGWVTSNVRNMSFLFSKCESLATLDLSGWNTSNVTNMENMFYDCRSLTSLDLSNFKVRNAYNTQKMFLSCSKLQTIFVSSDWSLSGVTTNMFQGCTALVGGEGTKYDENHVDKAYAVIDKGTEKPGYFTGISLNSDAFHTLADSIKHITFGKASNHADVVANANATVTPLGSAGSSSSYAVSGYTVTENGEATLYVLSEYAPIIAPADCTSLIGNSLDGRVVTFEREDLSDSASRAWFDTSKVTNMTKMFSDGSSGNRNSITINGLDTFDTSKVTDMQYMFCGDGNLQPIDLSAFDTSNVTDMKFMFYNCSGLTSIGDISGWDVSGVTDMQRMFNGCQALTSLDLSAWDVSSVTVMSYMFYNCSSLTDVGFSQWDVSKVQKMERMFAGCQTLTSLDLSAWNTSSVTDMSYMFYACKGLTSLNISAFDTSNVKNMENMFWQCSGLTWLNLLGWNTSAVTNMRYMFSDCNSLTTVYVGDGWTADEITDNNSVRMFDGCTSLVGGAGTTYDRSNTDKTYAVIDGQDGQKGYLTFAGTLNTVDVHSLLAEHTDINSVVFGSFDEHKNNVTGAEATPVSFAGNAVNCYLVGSTAYFLSAQPIVVWYDASNLFKELTGIQTITFESVNGTAWFDTSRVTNMKGMFEALETTNAEGKTVFESSITAINGLDTFDTSNVTDMTNMFRHCESLAGALDLSSWDTASVTGMEAMFDGLRSVTEIKFGAKFDTSKVTSMKHMFNECENLSAPLDLSMFDTSNVTNMFAMFNRCTLLPSITFGEKFNTSKVTTMGYMFCNCHTLVSLNLSGWDISNVTTLSNTFSNCLKLEEVDISGWNTQNVTDMGQMFYYGVKLTSIKGLGSLNTSKVTSLWQTFDSCNVIEKLDLSGWDTSKVQYMCWLFANCRELSTIYVGDGWSISSLVADDGGDKQMFGWCYKLSPEYCTDENSKANNEYVNKTRAYVGDGGYLTYKSASTAG